MKTMLETAIEYCNTSGFSVIPIRSDSKKPYIEWREFQDRKATEKEIRTWWKKFPNANLGIVTGAVSGIVVVDVDIDKEKGINGFDTIKEKKLTLPATPTVRTGRGGCHYYFRHPEGEISNFQNRDDLRGIDLRGDGGYVVAPPSIHETGRRYEWIIPLEKV